MRLKSGNKSSKITPGTTTESVLLTSYTYTGGRPDTERSAHDG